jgi:hypothetical protein
MILLRDGKTALPLRQDLRTLAEKLEARAREVQETSRVREVTDAFEERGMVVFRTRTLA